MRGTALFSRLLPNKLPCLTNLPDFHPDQFYKVHSSTSEDHACHSGHGPAGTYGAETSDCDAPVALVNATFDWIAANIRDSIDFVVWTGDSARHDSDEDIPRSADEVLGTNRLLAAKFAETFGSSATAKTTADDEVDASKGDQVQRLEVPVIPTFGNNDILPHNILLPGPNKWLARYADIWAAFIPEEQRHSFEFGGWYYVEVIPNKLAVFSLNTLYFFDRNAGVDDCVKPSEPGFKHMEWLRVQLQFMRDRGMKAILTGHVPPARTDSKMLWDETCWQKYTLWLRQFRDVVVAGLYGHMNIDHFMLADTKDISIDSSAKAKYEDDADPDIFEREYLDDELTIQSATDYLEELRQGWSKLPKVKATSELGSKGDLESSKKKGKKDKDKKKKKKDENKQKLGGEFAERYQLSLVSPSIVPNYFPTIRIFEYNITGLEDAVTWTDSSHPLPVFDMPAVYAQNDETDAKPELELREVPDVDTEKKKKKKKKNKGGKGKKPDADPNLVVPSPPAKSAPPGPAYSLQPLTLLGYEQYFANLTYLNNDIKATAKNHDDELSEEKWREGKHGSKKPKSSKPKPRKFAFEVEYTTRDDKLFHMSDLTVRSFVELAYRMGRTAGKSKSSVPGELPSTATEEVSMDVEEAVESHEDVDVDTGSDISDEEVEDDDIESQSDDLETEKSKKKKKGDKKKKKKKKKKAKDLNKTWLHFLRHAFVSTVDDEDLRDQFS